MWRRTWKLLWKRRRVHVPPRQWQTFLHVNMNCDLTWIHTQLHLLYWYPIYPACVIDEISAHRSSHPLTHVGSCSCLECTHVFLCLDCSCTPLYSGPRCLFFSDHTRSQPELEKLIGITFGVIMLITALAIMMYCFASKRWVSRPFLAFSLLGLFQRSIFLCDTFFNKSISLEMTHLGCLVFSFLYHVL